MEPGLRVESLTEQSAFWPITQWPLELETWILIEDSSPRAAVNNEPWITLGTRTCSSEVFSPNEIGISETVFGVYSERGYTWRYVPNERIPYLKLEKVIKKDLHIDTDEEKAIKLKSAIDKIQDDQIAKNKEAIDKLKWNILP